MSQLNEDPGTEWIYCRDVEGKCSGLNPESTVLEKKSKTIKVHGKEVKGWMVKIVQEQGEGHMKLDYCDLSNE